MSFVLPLFLLSILYSWQITLECVCDCVCVCVCVCVFVVYYLFFTHRAVALAVCTQSCSYQHRLLEYIRICVRVAHLWMQLCFAFPSSFLISTPHFLSLS